MNSDTEMYYNDQANNPAEVYAIYYYRQIGRPLNVEEIDLFNDYIDLCNKEVEYDEYEDDT